VPKRALIDGFAGRPSARKKCSVSSFDSERVEGMAVGGPRMGFLPPGLGSTSVCHNRRPTVGREPNAGGNGFALRPRNNPVTLSPGVYAP